MQQEQAPSAQQKPSRLCEGCSRPRRVCLCPALPPQPVRLHGHVVVLQHPHELKVAFATVPLLKRCTQPCTIVVRRELRPDKDPALQRLMDLTRPTPPQQHAAADGTDAAATTQPTATTTQPTATATQPTPTTAPPTEAAAAQLVQEAAAAQPSAQPVSEPNGSASSAAAAPAPARTPVPLYVLFPGPKAVPLEQVVTSPAHVARLRQAAASCAAAAVDAPPQPGCAAAGASRAAAGDALPPPRCAAPGAAAPVGVISGPQQTDAEHTSEHTADGAQGGARPMEEGNVVQGAGVPLAGGADDEPAYVLLAVDGTWSQAKEMFNTLNREFLTPHGNVTLVLLPPTPEDPPQDTNPTPSENTAAAPAVAGGSAAAAAAAVSPAPAAAAAPAGGSAAAAAAAPAGGSAAAGGSEAALTVVPSKACLLKKEPVDGYLTTYEAVCRALALLEGDTQPPGFINTLLAPLQLWTEHQAQFDLCTRDRISGKREADSDWVRSRQAKAKAKGGQGANDAK